MRISLSLKNDSRGRHLILTASSKDERNDIYSVILDQITGGRAANREIVWRSTAGRGRAIDHVIYRFHVSYLEKLALTFPQAEWSAPAERYRKKHLYEEVLEGPAPKLTIPRFNGKLWDFQAKGVKWIEGQLEEFSACMINDEVGLGKSVMCLAAIARRNHLKSRRERFGRYRKILVVTTNSGKWSWRKIAHDPVYVPGKRKPNPPMFPLLDLCVVDGLRAKRHDLLAQRRLIKIVNTDMLRISSDGKISYPELFDQTWDLIIIDEFHKFKNAYAQVSRGFLELSAKEIVVLSGTPFLNRPEELWTIFHRVNPEMWPDYASFVAKLPIFGEDGKPIGYNREQVKKIKTFLDEHSIRRRKQDVEIDFPEEMPPTLVPVELTAEQKKLYVKLRDEFKMELDDGTVKTVAHALAHIIRLKQACFSPELYGGSKHSAKIDKLHDLVEELVASGEKAIIFSQWAKACDILLREFEKYDPAFVTGSVKSKDRPAQEDKFNRSASSRLYIGTIGANQEAITLGAATYVIFTDQEWNPYKMHQAFGRSAGGGLRGVWAKDKKIYRMELRAFGTIEDFIDELLATKSRLFGSFIEKDGGTTIKRATVSAIRELLVKEMRNEK